MSGYRLYSGVVGGQQTNVVDAGPALSLTVSNLQVGVHYFFFATAYNAEGLESEPSNIVIRSNRISVPVVWVSPSDIVYGTALGPGQLNATSSVPGTFSYDPPSGTVLRAGSAQVLSVVFTPADTNAYLGANTTVALNVSKKPLVVTAESATKTCGEADPTFTASFTGFANGDTAATLGGTLALARTAGESVGSYPITPSGLTSSDYVLLFNPGTLSITAAAPVLAAQAPVILSLAGASTDTVVITWTAVSNVTYRVQYKEDLNATQWTDLDGDVTASGSTASQTDIQTGANRFYRIQVLQ